MADYQAAKKEFAAKPHPWLGLISKSATVVGAVGLTYFMFGTISGPLPPKDTRLLADYQQTKGPASVHDGYLLLLGKAGLYGDAEEREIASRHDERTEHLTDAIKDLWEALPLTEKPAPETSAHQKLLNYLQGIQPLILPTVPAANIGGQLVHVPGDLKMDSLDWSSRETQTALLADGSVRVEVSPEALSELISRYHDLVDLGASEEPARPHHKPTALASKPTLP